MIEPTWRRIAGIHAEDNGSLGVVWLAHDPQTSVLTCYDAAMFRREVFAVVSEGISARGRHYPIAWRKQDEAFADKLTEAGLNMLPESCADNQSLAEVISREIWQKLRTGQFRVERRVGEWLKEYSSYDSKKNIRKDGEEDWLIPTSGFPLMSATRHAIEMLAYAKAEQYMGGKKIVYPKRAIV